MCDANVQASVFKSPGKFVWKGVKGVRVLLALVFVSFGNCSNMYLLVHISLKRASRYVNAMRPGSIVCMT